MILYGEAFLHLWSTLQKIVSLSSTDVEYFTLSEICKLVKRIRHVLKELEDTQNSTEIYQNNSRAIEWANGVSAKLYSRRKRIDIQDHFVNNWAKYQTITLTKIPYNKMKSDLLTTPKDPKPFRNALNDTSILSNLYNAGIWSR